MKPAPSPCVSMWACVGMCTRARPHTQLILRNPTWRLWFLMSLGRVVPSGLPPSSHGPSPFRAIQIIYFDSFFSVRCLYSVVGIYPKLCTWLEDLRSLYFVSKNTIFDFLAVLDQRGIASELKLSLIELSYILKESILQPQLPDFAYRIHVCVCMYTYECDIYMYIYMNVTYIYTHIHTHTYIYLSMWHIYIWMWHTHTHTYIYICMYVTYIYVNVTQEVGRVPEDNHLSYCLYP